jgi:hypothetical protein
MYGLEMKKKTAWMSGCVSCQGLGVDLLAGEQRAGRSGELPTVWRAPPVERAWGLGNERVVVEDISVDQ